jgi:hypothetical protein
MRYGIAAGLETLSLGFTFRIENNQVLWFNLASQIAVSAMVFFIL